ncbi:MFS transporter [Streptomyces sp. NPDC051555]|uniref:MFS transporter n=1 Tax=Streptomyces sp. NPDC051555 TaxID=3365657 RepID=UPI0037ADAF83
MSASTPQPTQPIEAAPYARRWLMLPVVLAALFMAQFDLYVVNVAAPTLQRELGAGPVALELIVAGYAFTYASGLITGGRLGDLFGSRVMFLGGALAFTLASLLCGIAQSPGQLVTARLLQGVTGAAMVPQVLALITGVFSPAERPRALAWFGFTVGVGAVAGQVLGGMLLQAGSDGIGWRAIFLVNVPAGLLTFLLARRLVPKRAAGAGPRGGLDPVGAIGIPAGLALALVPMMLGGAEGWPLWTWLCLAAAVPVLLGTFGWERALARRGGRPLLDLSLFRIRSFHRGLVVSGAVFGAFFSFMFALTLVLQSGLGLSPLAAGFSFAPLGLAFAGASMAARRIPPARAARTVLGGTLVAAAGLVVLLGELTWAADRISALRLLLPMVLIGLGNGLAVPALTGAVLTGVGPGQAGSAAGVLTTAQQFASAAGVALLGSVFFSVLGSGEGPSAYAIALRWVAGIGLVLVLVAAAASRALPRPEDETGAETGAGAATEDPHVKDPSKILGKV